MKPSTVFEAIEEDDEETVRKFVEKKNFSWTDTDPRRSETVAHTAARNGRLNILKYLLDKKPDLVDTVDFYGNKIFFLAIENHHLHVVKYLVQNEFVDISEKNDRCFGNTAIHRAVEYDDMVILRYFLEERKGNVNILNKFKQPPVFLAAENKFMDIVKYLVEERRADLTLVDHNKHNILYTAVNNDDLPLIKYVLDERKVPLDINWKDNFGDTIVHRAATLNKYQVLKYVVEEKQADVNTYDIWHQTPLHSAARQSHYAVCKFLLEHGADTEVKNDRDRLPFQEARDERIINLIKNASGNLRSEMIRKRRQQLRNVAPSSGRGQILPQDVRVEKIKSHRQPRNVAPSLGLDQILSQDARVERINSTSGCIDGDISLPSSSLQLQSFLAVAASLIEGSRGLNPQQAEQLPFTSPRMILQNRIDPVAVNSIKTVPRMKYLK